MGWGRQAPLRCVLGRLCGAGWVNKESLVNGRSEPQCSSSSLSMPLRHFPCLLIYSYPRGIEYILRRFGRDYSLVATIRRVRREVIREEGLIGRPWLKSADKPVPVTARRTCGISI